MILKHCFNVKVICGSIFAGFCLLIFFNCQPRGSSGKVLYETHCANCHLENGEGVGELIPPLTNSNLLSGQPEDLACIIRHGIVAIGDQEAVFEEYTMPPNKSLSEVEIANIIHYARSQWATEASAIPFTEIKKSLKTCN